MKKPLDKVTKSDLLGLNLHQQIKGDGYIITSVVTGWIYEFSSYYGPDGEEVWSSVFVPMRIS